MSTDTRRVLQHLRSEEEGKVPSAEQIELGEIAVNYNANEPFLTIKDNEGNLQKIPTAEVCYLPASIGKADGSYPYIWFPSEETSIVYGKVEKAYYSHQIVALGSIILQELSQEATTAITAYTCTYESNGYIANFYITNTNIDVESYDIIGNISDIAQSSKLPIYEGIGLCALSENYSGNTASANYSHAEGYITQARGRYSHAAGYSTVASGTSSHAEGYITKANGNYSHSEGYNTVASGESCHAEGTSTTAISPTCHAEGYNTVASGTSSHAEGYITKANGNYSHSEGYQTTAAGNYSHAAGYYTQTTNDAEHAEGRYNETDTDLIHSVGIGTSNTARVNAEAIYKNGKKYIYGVAAYDGTKASIEKGALDIATVIGNMSAATENFITSAFTESNYIRKDAILSIDCGTY